MRRAKLSLGWWVCLGLLPGCHCGGDPPLADADVLDIGPSDGSPLDEGAGDMGTDPVPCTLPGRTIAVRLTEVDAIDLLFMVDNSFSMLEEQAALIAELPRIVEVLASGDRDGDGAEDFRPLASIHVGVITSDMGIGGIPISANARCTTTLGDDGVMLTAHRGSDASCAASYPRFLEFLADSDDPAAFAADVGCLAATGVEGCAFEQQLEAVLKALTPADSPIVFEHVQGDTLVRSTQGHGGSGLNGGFLRDLSLLAVVMVTDEDDCSSRDIDLYDVISPDPVYPVPRDVDGFFSLNRHCTEYRHVQYDVYKRHVLGLLALRPDFPDLLLFAAIAGVAPDVIAANTSTLTVEGRTLTTTDYAGILASPSMQETPDELRANLVPGCVRPDPDAPSDPLRVNAAYPPRRLVQVAEGLDRAGAHGVVASICEARDAAGGDYHADFSRAVDEILLAVENALPPGCIDEELVRRPSGDVQCEVHETLPVGVTCASQAARGRDPVPVRVEGSGPSAREVCRVLQLVPTEQDREQAQGPSGEGWYYDDYTSLLPMRCPPGHQGVVFSAGGGITVDADVAMECLVGVPPDAGRADVGSGCQLNPNACDLSGADLESLRAQYRRPAASLTCAAAGNCHLTCAVDLDCPALQRCQTEGAASFCQDPLCADP